MWKNQQQFEQEQEIVAPALALAVFVPKTGLEPART
jgi:hypothetical protein